MPARGVRIALFRDEEQLAERLTNADGRVPDVAGGAVAGGTYRLVFDVAGYFATQGRDAPFLHRVTIEFVVRETDPHYHVPLLLSPYACTSYRGS